MIHLRAPEPSDLDFLYRLECQPDVWRVSWGEGPISRQLLWDYLHNYTADIYRDRQMRWIIVNGAEAAGTIDITDYDPANGHAMLGIAVDERLQGRGIATAAIGQAISYCRDTLHMHQLAVIVPRCNVASMRIFSRAGFKPTGCLRSWLRRGDSYHDAIILQLML